MTQTIEIDAGTLMFSDTEDLYATGVLVPYDVECRSSIGRFRVRPGSFSIPEDVSALSVNVEHDRTQPVAVFASITEQPGTGYMGRLRFSNTPEGRTAYAEAKSGKRKHLSVETRGVVIRDGHAVAGRIFGGAVVEHPAFPGATLLAAAADTPQDATSADGSTVTIDGQDLPAHTETEDSHTDTASDGSETNYDTRTTIDRKVLDDGTIQVTTTTVSVTTETPAETTDQTDTTTTEGTPTVTDTAIPSTFQGSQKKNQDDREAGGLSLREVNVLLAAAHNGNAEAARTLADEGQRAADLYAALTDIKATGTGGVAGALGQPKWIGEAYAQANFQRRYVPLLAHDDLTGFTIQGFRWDTPPVMGAWAGNKTNVPSAGVAVSGYTKDANGFAGAHDVDRRLRDFSVPEFWDGYWRHMSNSYNRLTDADALATLLAGATAVTAGTIPTGIPTAAALIVDGYLAVQDEGTPTFAIVAPDLWREFVLTPRDKTLEYLSVALNLEDGNVGGFRVIPGRSTDIPAGQVLVGIGQAATVYELPGSPIRVEGLDMVRGGIDPGAFGYEVTDVEDADAFALVTAPAAP